VVTGKPEPEESTGKGLLFYQKGREAIASGNLVSAIRFLEQSAQIDPHFKTFELLGECLIKRGQCSEAVAALSMSVELGNKPYRALYLLAQALESIGHREEAIARLTQAIEMKPDYKAARALLDRLHAASR
jgi:tetratricopeptide (TPR) repeat protein